MITIAGVGSWALPESARARIARGVLVVGAARHLACIEAGRRFELSGDLGPALDAIASAAGEAVVLASGDPGFFGIVRALAERFGRERIEVLPGVSCVAAAFARAGLSWDDAVVVTAHGRNPRTAVNTCRAHAKVAVLTAPDFGPVALASLLIGTGRRLVVAECLGEPDERVVEGSAETIARGRFRDPNVVLVLDEPRAVAPKGVSWPRRLTPQSWALPEEAFEHRAGMITKSEVRALALARLGPGLGDLVWDVGAGSGSVGIECARHGAAVIAVERQERACRMIERNAARHGVCLEVVCGEAPQSLASLPEPDAVFVGGSGREFEEVLRIASFRVRRAVAVAIAGIERVAPAARVLAAEGLEVEAVLLQASRLQPVGSGPCTGAPGELHRLAPLNPVFMVSGVRR